MISFVCNICGQENTVAVIEHEPSSCTRVGCRSNVRLRALLYLLSTELFGKGFLLSDFPTLPAIKGATATNQTKPATLETGVVIQVPPFIGEGDVIRINTETGEYQTRA